MVRGRYRGVCRPGSCSWICGQSRDAGCCHARCSCGLRHTPPTHSLLLCKPRQPAGARRCRLPRAAAAVQVGHMSWGQRFEVTNYQAYDIGERPGWGVKRPPLGVGWVMVRRELGTRAPLASWSDLLTRIPLMTLPPRPPRSARRHPVWPGPAQERLHQRAVGQPALQLPRPSGRPAAHRRLPGAPTVAAHSTNGLPLHELGSNPGAGPGISRHCDAKACCCSRLALPCHARTLPILVVPTTSQTVPPTSHPPPSPPPLPVPYPRGSGTTPAP